MDLEILKCAVEITKPFVIGAFGGVVAIFASRTKPNSRAILSGMVVSCYAGWLGWKLSNAFSFSPDYRDIITAVGGLCGVYFIAAVVKGVSKILTKAFGIDINIQFDAVDKRNKPDPAIQEETGTNP